MIKKALSILRKNSRTNINNIADQLKINRSTFYDHFPYLNFYIRRFTSLLDFNKLGYFTSVFIVKKDPRFLREKNINNLFELENHYYLEVLFKELIESYNFREKYNDLIVYNSNILETIKKEEFLVDFS